jgi:hypothetical protein
MSENTIQRNISEIMRNHPDLYAEFKDATQKGRLAYKAGDYDGVAREKTHIKKLINKAIKEEEAKQIQIEIEKQKKGVTMNKVNDFFTTLNDVPLKLIIKVSTKWAIGLAPFALFVLLFLWLIAGLFHPYGYGRR